jgi:hypothetical protein
LQDSSSAIQNQYSDQDESHYLTWTLLALEKRLKAIFDRCEYVCVWGGGHHP